MSLFAFVSGTFELLNSGFQLLKNLKSFRAEQSKKSNTLANLPERFIHLYECHGIHRNQIPAYVGRGLTLHAMSDLQELSKQLTPEIVHFSAALFGVNQDWLECVSEQVYNVPDFYKHPEDFGHYINNLKNNGNELWCYVLRTRESMERYDDSDGAFLFVETIGSLNNREIVRYHPVGHLRTGYWKSR